MVLGFSAARNMTVGNIVFKRGERHPVSYDHGPSKKQVDYRLVRRN